MTASGMRSPEMRKKRRLRSVCAPQSRSVGTSIGPKLSFSMRVPDMRGYVTAARTLLSGLLLRCDLGVHLGHVERLGLRDHLLELRSMQRAGLLEQDDLLAKDNQRRNATDAEGAGEFLLFLGIYLGEDHVRMRFGRLLVHRRKAAAGRAPRRPEIDQHHSVVVDGLL